MASYPDPWVDDGKVWAYYNVTTTADATTLLYTTNNISAMYIVDGGSEISVTVAKTYTFQSTGTWLVKYSLSNNSFISYSYPPNVSDAGMFRGVTALLRCYLPSTVVRFSHSFRGCTNLQYVNLSALKCVGNFSFQGCSNLTGDLELPLLDDSLTGSSTATINRAAFTGSGYSRIINLGSVYYLGGSTSGEGCFAGMTNLTYAELPATFAKYDSHVFHNCNKLKTVILHSVTPPVPTSSTAKFFGYAPASGCRIYVPKNSVDAYKEAQGWSMYASMIFPLWEGNIAINHMSLGDFRRRIMLGISTPKPSILPEGYTKLDYISMSTRWSLGFKPQEGMSVSFAWRGRFSSDSTNARPIQPYQDGANAINWGINWYGRRVTAMNGTANTIVTPTSVLFARNTKIGIKASFGSSATKLTVNYNGNVYNYSAGAGSRPQFTKYDIRLNAGAVVCDFYRTIFYSDTEYGTVMRDYVPCKDSDNNYGFYELVTEHFYTNASWTGGYD